MGTSGFDWVVAMFRCFVIANRDRNTDFAKNHVH